MLNITNENFEQEVLKSGKRVVVDFWAAWCGPCKMLAPIFEELADEHPEVKFAKINVDEQVELCMQYKVVSIPTLFVFENGEVVDKVVGYRDKEELEELLF